jgi:1-phosphatidylinositol-4-phosphate 5-kinase
MPGQSNHFLYKMDHYDAVTGVTLGSIAILASSSFIFLNIFFSEARRFPSILLTIISFGELLLSIHWTITAAFTPFILHLPEPDTSSFFCQLNSALSVIGGTIQYVFQLFFTGAIIMMFQNALTEFKFQNFFVVMPCVVVVGALVMVYFLGSFKKDVFGYCSISSDAFEGLVGVSVFLVLYFGLVVVTLVRLRKFRSKSQKSLTIKNSEKFYVFYKRYTIFMLFYYVLTSLDTILSSMFDQYIQTQAGQCPESCMRLFYMIRLVNNCTIYLPIISFLLRVSDPYLSSMIKNYMKKRYKKHFDLVDESMTLEFNLSSSKRRNSSFTVDSKDVFATRTIKRVRMEICKSMLMSLKLYYQLMFPTLSELKRRDSNLYYNNIQVSLQKLLVENKKINQKKNIKDSKQINKDSSHNHYNSLLNKLSPQVHSNFLNSSSGTLRAPLLSKQSPRLNLNIQSLNHDESLDLNLFPEYLNTKMNTKFFKEFLSIIQSREYDKQDISSSFDFVQNKENIRKLGFNQASGGKQMDGGASGEFFFRTWDKKFIIKTISEEEQQVFEEMIGQYKDHFVQNEKSLISRIIGLFSFKFDLLDNKIRIIVMENILKIDSKYISRKYDLKGSTHSRRVLSSSNLRRVEQDDTIDLEFTLKNRTLKDIDFNSIDKKLAIPLDQSHLLFSVLSKDIEFLKSQKLMDYSLLLGVVKFEDLRNNPDDNDTLKDDINELIKKGIFFWDQSFEFGYILGIIDYFQQYTFSKFVEKYSKRLIYCSCGLDTSSQSSAVYSQRFFKYMTKIFDVGPRVPDLQLDIN